MIIETFRKYKGNLLENVKQRFKRTISWNGYRSEKKTQPKKSNLDYLVDPTFRNMNKFFVLLFKNGDNDPTSNSFDKYYMSLVERKGFNLLIDNKLFFEQPLINKQEAYEKPIYMSRNNDHTTGSLLDYLHHQKNYELIGRDLRRQSNTSIPH